MTTDDISTLHTRKRKSTFSSNVVASLEFVAVTTHTSSDRDRTYHKSVAIRKRIYLLMLCRNVL